MKSHWAAGNANLKGKKWISAACKCCTIVNLKEKYLDKLAMKEMKDAVEMSEMQKENHRQ